MSEEQLEESIAAISVSPAADPTADEVAAVVANVTAVTNGVNELQQQIQQLQEQQHLAESKNLNLLATLEQEREQHRQQLENSAAQESLPAVESPAIMTDGLESRVQRLERELQVRTEERENYKNKLQVAEKQLADVQAAAAEQKQNDVSNVNLEDQAERAVVQETLEKLTATLKESTEQCERFERQNTQLHNQVKALKEVISVHKDLLAIRGMETEQLKTTIKLLEDHSKAEKERRAAVLAKMEAAVRLNAELKNEYETQLKIFNDLKGKYELKVELLHAENQRIKKLIPVEPEEDIANAEPVLEEPVVE